MECWEYLIVHTEDPTIVWNFTAFSVKLHIHFLKDPCAFVLPFGSSGLLTGFHAKEKFTYDQLEDGYVQMGVCLILDTED